MLDGSYRYTVMPMGLKSSSFEFQRRMDSIIAPCSFTVLPLSPRRCRTFCTGLQTRWLGVLQSFNITEIQYVPGERFRRTLVSVFWERLFELLGTKLVYSAPYHHQSNGQVERLNQTLGNFLRAFIKGGAAWHKNLVVFEFAYNSARHSSTGVEPFRVVYCDVPPCPLATVNSGLVRSKAATDMEDLLVNTRATVSTFPWPPSRTTLKGPTNFGKVFRCSLSFSRRCWVESSTLSPALNR